MTTIREKIKISNLDSQRGAALVIAVLVLLILTVIGIYAVTTSTMDTKISGYHKGHMSSFYAADAGLDYALATYPYGTLTAGTWNFDSTYQPPKFDVAATYLGNTPPPPGSGTGTRAGFVAHHYRTDSNGQDPAEIANAKVQMWGYRIGF